MHRDIGAEQSQPLLHLQVGPRWQQEETVKMDLHTLEHARVLSCVSIITIRQV